MPCNKTAPICKQAAANVKAHCTGKPCFPCGLALSVIYSKYNAIAHSYIHKLQAQIAANVGLLLKTPNPLAVIKPSPVAPAHPTTVIVPGKPAHAAAAKKAHKGPCHPTCACKAKGTAAAAVPQPSGATYSTVNAAVEQPEGFTFSSAASGMNIPAQPAQAQFASPQDVGMLGQTNGVLLPQ